MDPEAPAPVVRPSPPRRISSKLHAVKGGGRIARCSAGLEAAVRSSKRQTSVYWIEPPLLAAGPPSTQWSASTSVIRSRKHAGNGNLPADYPILKPSQARRYPCLSNRSSNPLSSPSSARCLSPLLPASRTLAPSSNEASAFPLSLSLDVCPISMNDSARDPQPSADADAALRPFPSLPPVPEAAVEELTPPKIKQIVDLRDTSHADLARMGFTDSSSHYDAAVASGSIALVDAGDEAQQQLAARSRLPSYASSSGDGYTLEDDLRAMNDQMKRVLAFCETQRENPLRLQAKINDLQEQLRQAIAEKNYWMKRCKDLTGHQPPAQEVAKVDLQCVKSRPRKRTNSELILIADTWAQPGRDGIYSEDTSSVVESDASSSYSEAELVDGETVPRSCFRLLQCSDEQCEVFTPMNRSIRTQHRSRNNVQLMWDEPPKTVLIVKKPNEPDTTDMMVRLASWLHKERKMEIFLEPTVHEELALPSTKTWGSKPGEWEECQSAIDFVVSLGGDGTVLWVSSLFKKSVPPVFSLAMGSLGFLTPFDAENAVEHLTSVINGGFYMSLRSRLVCSIFRNGKEREISGNLHALNEVVIDRGPSGALVELNCYCDGLEITKIAADGIIIATPTGSTAYSLSAGGSMAHPSVPAMLFTPICPHTLSFRPLVFHDSATLKIEFPSTSRASACYVSFDGKNRVRMERGDCIIVRVSSYPLPSICRVNENQDWFESMITNLNWNQRRAQKPWQPPVTSKI